MLGKKSQLTGLEKAAILMNVLGEERSFPMMKELKDSELRHLLTVMGQMKKAPIATINSVLREFIFKISEHEEIIFDQNLASPEVVQKGLGEDRMNQIFGRVKNVGIVDRKHLSALDEIDPKFLAQYLVEEHPQTVALIVSHMDLSRQILMVKQLPDSLRTEVLIRMANLEYVAPEKIDELNDVLKKELGAVGKLSHGQVGGLDATAEIVNALDTKSMNAILARVEDKDPLIAEEIRQRIFMFTDIVKIDDRGVQLILREVPGDKLLLALKSAPEELRQRIYSAMSERAAQMLQEDLAALGPQKVTDIEKAQREIVNIVKRLESEGKIVIGVSEEDVVE